jgi:glycosyltransferase involved in cell wall biosynthesis
MAKTSIIIPARAEKYENLKRTIDSIRENATGEYEIIVGFNGPPFYDFPDVLSVKLPRDVGIKNNINILCAMAEGKYIYKSDAHCSFGKGFDEILQAEMQEDWIVMPRFYVLNGETWEWQDDRFYDYFYLCCPFTDPRGFRFKAGGHWPERTAERLDTLIDETPQIHGSGWFTSKDRYFELGGFPCIDPEGHAQEPIWLALKNQLMGGKCMVNKKTWYAHLHQSNEVKGYHFTRDQERVSYDIAAKTFMKDPRMMGWLEKNLPMPTWPDNWKEVYEKWLHE